MSREKVLHPWGIFFVSKGWLNLKTYFVSKKYEFIKKKSIRENFGMASKATLTSAPRKSVLNESNDMVARMQKLANISKIK